MIKRKTIQCDLVLNAVNKLQCHATANEIYDYIVKDYPSIGRGTVYRNLQKLSEMGKIQKIEIPGGPDRYDHLCHDHNHIICIKCGKLFDVDMEYITNLEKSVIDTHGFEITGYNIILKGICPECHK